MKLTYLNHAILCLLVSVAVAQDPVKIAPDAYKLEFENEYKRLVMNSKIKLIRFFKILCFYLNIRVDIFLLKKSFSFSILLLHTSQTLTHVSSVVQISRKMQQKIGKTNEDRHYLFNTR